MAQDQRVANVLQGLRALQSDTLSILRLSEPLCNSNTPSKQQRSSDVSSLALENPSPASLEADLAHYKELFSKLRFSYLEQVTKEKFLRAIVGDPPQIVEPAENTELETQLVEVKQVLKQQKQHVADIISELDARGRELSRRYETIELQIQLLQSLPEQIEGLTKTLGELARQNQEKHAGDVGDDTPEMKLPLPATLELLEAKKVRQIEVEARLRALKQQIPQQKRLLEQEEQNLKGLERERARHMEAAREAVERKKADCGEVDQMEMKGRWLRGVESGVRELLEC